VEATTPWASQDWAAVKAAYRFFSNGRVSKAVILAGHFLAKGKSIGRAYLVKQLRERGFSRRQSVQIINVILESMISALKRGEKVKVPFGHLKRVRRYFNQYWETIDDWPADQDGYTVVYGLDEAGDRELHPEWFPVRKRRRDGRRAMKNGSKRFFSALFRKTPCSTRLSDFQQAPDSSRTS
jgi:hypothetical protein